MSVASNFLLHIQIAQIDGNLEKTLAKIERYGLKVIHNKKPKNLVKSSYTRSYSRYPQKITLIYVEKKGQKRTTVL